MISIVLVGRNDNYGGDFKERLFATTRYQVAELDARAVDYEIVYVEWNPLPDSPPLAEKVVREFEKARGFIVDPLVHQLLSDNSTVGVMEFHAKNVGVRRSRGDMVLLTNPDNYFGKEILDCLADDDFAVNTAHVAGRVNIDDSGDIDNRDLRERPPSTPERIGTPGDFLLCSRSLWDRSGGFREDLRFSNHHKDSIHLVTISEIADRITAIGRTYHLNHGRDLHSSRRVDFRWRKVDRTPQTTWGHDDILVADELEPRLTRLNLRPDLIAAAGARRIPEAVVPHSYRPLPPTLKLLRRRLGRTRLALRDRGIPV